MATEQELVAKGYEMSQGIKKLVPGVRTQVITNLMENDVAVVVEFDRKCGDHVPRPVLDYLSRQGWYDAGERFYGKGIMVANFYMKHESGYSRPLKINLEAFR